MQLQRAATHVVGVGVLTVLIAAFLSVCALVLFATFRDSSYDLVIFDQAVRSYAHFHPGISIIKGVHNGFGPHFSILGDHFSPILATLVPLYWIYEGPQTLLIAQSVLLALAIPPLWVFTRRAFGGGCKATTAAYLVCVAYGLSWPIATAVAFDFHEVAFAPLLIAVALERLQAGRLRPALIALAVLLLVKEDMGLLVAGIGSYLICSGTRTVPRQRMTGVLLIVAGIGYTALATYVLVPALGGRADYYWAYSTLGRNVPQVVWHIISHPLSAARMMISPPAKLNTLMWLFGTFCFLSLLSPIVLAAAPLLVERMLNSRYPNWWVAHFHYNAYLVMVLLCAAIDGAARLDRWTTSAWRHLAARRGSGPDGAARVSRPGFVAFGCAVAVLGTALFAFPRLGFGEALHAGFYAQTTRSRAAAAADAAVPSGVVVEAADAVGPELSRRDTVLLWDGEQPPLGSPWIVADVKRRDMTFLSVSAERARVALLLSSGYKVVFERDGYVVLHRGARTRGPDSAEASR